MASKKSSTKRGSTSPKIPPTPVELKFKNTPSELIDTEAFEAICLDLSKASKNFSKAIEKVSAKYSVQLKVENFFDLSK